MRIFKARLSERIERTPTVESFRFIADEKINFSAGQFVRVMFDPGHPGNTSLNKFLSFSSSPSKEYLEVTKRLSASEFSGRLSGLRPGSEIIMEGPFGNCVLRDDYKRIGFMVGGIGITPVISMLEYIIDKRLQMDIELFYSNRSEEDIAFKAELDLWQSKLGNMKIVYAVTDCPPKDKTCIFGHITGELFKGKATCLEDRLFFIFGPPGMVETMKYLCIDAGSGKANIKTESFIGY